MGIFLFTNRRFQRDRFLRNLQHLTNLRHRNIHSLCDFFTSRFATEFLHESPRSPNQFVDRLDHVHRNTNRASLIRNRARYRLANPPGGIRRKLISTPVLELVHGFHQADIAFLNQIEELQAAVRIFLGDGDHESEVRLHKFAFRNFRLNLPAHDCLQRALQLESSGLGLLFDLRDPNFYAADVFLYGLPILLFCVVRLPFELVQFLFERPHSLDSLFHQPDQPQFLRIREFKRPNEARQLNASATKIPPSATELRFLRLWSLIQFRAKLIELLIGLADLVDEIERFLMLFFNFFVGQLFVAELENVFDDAGVSPELLSDRNDLSHNNR